MTSSVSAEASTAFHLLSFIYLFLTLHPILCFITSLSLFTLFFFFPLLFLFMLHINVLLFLHLIPLSFVFGVSIIPASTFIYLACLHVFFSLLYFLPHLSFPIFHLFLLFELFFFPSSFFCILINVFIPSFHFCLFCFLFPSATFFPSFPSSFLLSHLWSFWFSFFTLQLFLLFAWDFAVVCLLLCRLAVRYQATTNTHQTLHTLSRCTFHFQQVVKIESP